MIASLGGNIKSLVIKSFSLSHNSNPYHSSKRVGDVDSGVVVWPVSLAFIGCVGVRSYRDSSIE